MNLLAPIPFCFVRRRPDKPETLDAVEKLAVPVNRLPETCVLPRPGEGAVEALYSPPRSAVRRRMVEEIDHRDRANDVEDGRRHCTQSESGSRVSPLASIGFFYHSVLYKPGCGMSSG